MPEGKRRILCAESNKDVGDLIALMLGRKGYEVESVQTAADQVLPVKERRRQVGDELYTALVNGGYNFWEHIHPLFLHRDITRHDMRELVRRGLTTTRGNYRSLLRLFGLPAGDYKRFLNFLAAHDCNVDFRAFRSGTAPIGPMRSPRLLPPLAGQPADQAPTRPDRGDSTY